MKLLRQVKPIEVKRCFIISDYVSHQKYSKEATRTKSRGQYLKELNKAKEIILKLPEAMLDLVIKGEWKKRFKAYSRMRWYIGVAEIDEIGVWKRAGGLPLTWTRGSLGETASLVGQALQRNPKKLSKRYGKVIPGILKNTLSIIKTEKYLLPIILPGGTMGRKGLKKMRGDIDDGCMRSVALAVSGEKTIKAYIGIRDKKLKA